MTALSFIRGGRRRLASLPSAAGGDPTEIWADGEGHLFTRCGGDLVAGPVSPSAIVQRAAEVASGAAPCTQAVADQMALLILAVNASAREGAPQGEQPSAAKRAQPSESEDRLNGGEGGPE